MPCTDPTGAAADQLWGIIARRIASETRILDPEDACTVIKRTLLLPSVRNWIGPGTAVLVSRMETVHDWRNHLPLWMVGLEGGLLVDRDSNHLFVMLRRRGRSFARVPKSLLLTVAAAAPFHTHR